MRTDDGDEFTADQVVIAAGSRAVVPDAIAECGVPYHTSDTIMRIADVPEHLIIVGGGFVACEFAHIFSALGSHVTLVIRGSTLLRGHDDDIYDALHRHRRQEVGDPQPPRGRPTRVQVGDGVEIRCNDGSTVRGDALLVATGRVPNGDLLDARTGRRQGQRERPGGRRRVPTHHRTRHFRAR